MEGWVNKKRDHGNLLFIDLRDNYGITQCIIDKDNKYFSDLEKLQLETVIKVEGKVVNRSKETINNEIDTGEIEVVIEKHEVLGDANYSLMNQFLNSVLGKFFVIGLVWSFSFQMLSEIRHLLMDMGYGFELQTTRITGLMVIFGSFLLTILIYLIGKNFI